MQEYILSNGIKLIYIKGTSELTSISIALEAGASQDGELFGIAHATEHMVYKSTKNRNEAKINKDFSEVFGFNNAMTNYPYVVYYGTLLGEDFNKGIELFSDVLINPTFPTEGYKEEMDVIIEELKEWDEELDQYCEDKLLYNIFNYNRLKFPIIGTFESLKKITLKDIQNFYNTYYSPKNTSIAISSALDFEYIIKAVEEYFGAWQGDVPTAAEECLEVPKTGIFTDTKEGSNSARVQINFPINNLTSKEVKALRVFNEYFGEGINSVLFDKLRTKGGLVYDVLTFIGYEKYIKNYRITFSTSREKVDKALEGIKQAISEIEVLEKSKIEKLSKSIRIKRLFKEEQSIRLTNAVATYSAMFKDYKEYKNSYENMEALDGEFIFNVAKKVLSGPSIEIIK